MIDTDELVATATTCTMGSWVMARIVDPTAGYISFLAAAERRVGFGSLRVEARIGQTIWRTSIFPQKGGGWLLPIKRDVRLAERLVVGAEVEIGLRLASTDKQH